ncbi:MAG: membrane protein insertion efficiency factor YidD, partial [Sphingomonadales bacterium]|nr:membrane protein insertion efficiency factor YidD [Sphingomonadales bacterium]
LIYLINRYQASGGGVRFNVECNFTPSCSFYAKEALEKKSLFTAVHLIINRLTRCNDRDCVHKSHDPLP